MDEPWFDAEESLPAWKIQSDGDYCHLLEGFHCRYDCSTAGIRQYAETLTTKPVAHVINTHYHFDHTANDAYFDAAFMTAESIPYATVPYTSFSGITFPRDYPVITTDGLYPESRQPGTEDHCISPFEPYSGRHCHIRQVTENFIQW